MDKTFPCRVDFPLMRVSFRTTLALAFWFLLGLFRISNVRHKYFELCQALGSPLLSAHGLGSIKPNVILFFTPSVAITNWSKYHFCNLENRTNNFHCFCSCICTQYIDQTFCTFITKNWEQNGRIHLQSPSF